MEEIRLTAELKKNCETKRERLQNLFEAFDIATLGDKMQDQVFKDIYNKVLSENVFLVSKDFTSYRDDCMRPGERITDERFDFMMSDEDFEKFQKISLLYFVEAGLTDINFRYKTDWHALRMESKTDLVNFIIDEILPAEIRKAVSPYRFNVVQQDKLIDIMRKVV